MASKTISISVMAYEKLDRARLSPRESFSKVIGRAGWVESGYSGRDLLSAMAKWPKVDDETLDRLEENQKLDRPPGDPWKR
jgi:predicted CopG family antitoxin